MEYLKIIKSISFSKTLLMNLIYFRWKFYKFPILVYRHTCIKKYGGYIQIDVPLTIGQLQIGRLRNGFQDEKERTIWNVSGAIILKGKVSFGRGSRIDVGKNAMLTLGDRFCASGNTTIICQKAITFGHDDLLSWDTFLMDTDFHHIVNLRGKITSVPKSITIASHVWIGYGVNILKGVTISDNTVIAAKSLITKSCDKEYVIIGSKGALKNNINWTY